MNDRTEPHIQWIGIRPGRKESLQRLDKVNVDFHGGLDGDHYGKAQGKRQITLISRSALDHIAGALGVEELDPKLTRRNLVIAGKHPHFQTGDFVRIGEEVLLEITGSCPPCSRMEENLGDAGFKAMAGNGGWIARVKTGGWIGEGMAIRKEDVQTSSL